MPYIQQANSVLQISFHTPINANNICFNIYIDFINVHNVEYSWIIDQQYTIIQYILIQAVLREI